MSEDNKKRVAMSIEEIKASAAELASELKSAGAGPLRRELRTKLIDLRAALFQRGIYDPVLGRFDSATVPQASLPELAEQLTSVAAAL